MTGDDLITAAFARPDNGRNEDTVLTYAISGIPHGLVIADLEGRSGERVESREGYLHNIFRILDW